MIVYGCAMIASPLVEEVAHLVACILEGLDEAQRAGTDERERHDDLARLKVALHGNAVGRLTSHGGESEENGE